LIVEFRQYPVAPTINWPVVSEMQSSDRLRLNPTTYNVVSHYFSCCHMMPTIIAVVSLVLSMTTAWLTLFRRGTVKMTQPTVIFFGPDTPKSRLDRALPKVFLRTLLFATSKRGRIIESLHIALSRNETRQNFNIWVYGNDHLVRGSGLFVGEAGVEANHHFLAPHDAHLFEFKAGQYQLEVFARLLGDSKQIRLFSQTLSITSELAVSLAQPNAGIYFDWGPDSASYLPYVEKGPSRPEPEDFLKVVRGLVGEAHQ
jgi:hypothetical protein